MPETPNATPTRADAFESVAAEEIARWQRFASPGTVTFPAQVGLVVEDIRRGWCRMRMPYRPELKHAGGVVHGGAISTLLDSVLVPAIGVSVESGSIISTVDLHVQFLAALVDDDAVAEGWVVRQGRRTVFGESEARAGSDGRLVAKAILTFAVSPPRSG